MFSQSQAQNKIIIFNSNENKGLLWKTLSDNGLFNDIDSTRFAEVQQNFENTINEILGETYGNKTVDTQKQNRLFIEKMVVNLKQFKNNEIYTAKDIKEKRKTDFDKELEEKQRNFDLMMKRDVPQDVDFSDEARTKGQQVEEKLENIDALLEQQQKEREKDLFSIQNNNAAVEESVQKREPATQPLVLFPDPQNQIHASNINTEISNNLLTQLLGKMDAILTNQEEIKELIRLRKKKSH
jgi:hypothetical protein